MTGATKDMSFGFLAACRLSFSLLLLLLLQFTSYLQ